MTPRPGPSFTRLAGPGGLGQAAPAGATALPDFTCHILAAASPLLPRLAALPFKLAIALPGPRPRPGFSRLALGVVRAILRRHSQVLPLPAFLSSGLTGQRLGLSCFARAAAGIRTPRPGRRRPVGLQGERARGREGETGGEKEGHGKRVIKHTYASEPQQRVLDFCFSLSDLSEL